jgi:hypothetical protein
MFLMRPHAGQVLNMRPRRLLDRVRKLSHNRATPCNPALCQHCFGQLMFGPNSRQRDDRSFRMRNLVALKMGSFRQIAWTRLI